MLQRKKLIITLVPTRKTRTYIREVSYYLSHPLIFVSSCVSILHLFLNLILFCHAYSFFFFVFNYVPKFSAFQFLECYRCCHHHRRSSSWRFMLLFIFIFVQLFCNNFWTTLSYFILSSNKRVNVKKKWKKNVANRSVQIQVDPK